MNTGLHLQREASIWVVLVCVFFLLCSLVSSASKATYHHGFVGDGAPARKPNIVFIVTDDQGMGDIGVYGNPKVKTPAIDQLYNESLRFSDFHVDPTCSPTRAALMTGKYSLRAGVWHTVMGRHMLESSHITLAEVLRDNGYATGHFGKWHLGDSFPFRPQDQGFEHVVMHGGGGVGNSSDFWGNTQFGDYYYVNGKPTPFAGFTTQVWFSEAKKYIQSHLGSDDSDRPFFAYIATPTPHSPWRAPAEDLEPYLDSGLSSDGAKFYAVISNLDNEISEFREFLSDNNIERNTLLVFMTDNGTAMPVDKFIAGTGKKSFTEFKLQYPDDQGWQFNAGMRGIKAEVYDGGHRVPFLLHWPNAGFDTGRTIRELTAHIDVLPTLVDLLQLNDPSSQIRDGVSWRPILEGQVVAPRKLVVTHQRVIEPSKDRPAAVLSTKWRYLPHSQELYDIETDPGQSKNVFTLNSDVVQELQSHYDNWWESVSKDIRPLPRPIIGSLNAPLVRLTSHDFAHGAHKIGHGDTKDAVAFFPGFGRKAHGPSEPEFIDREHMFKPLPFELRAAESGEYIVELYYHDKPAGKVVPSNLAFLKVNDQVYSQELSLTAIRARFSVILDKGPVTLTGWFADSFETKTTAALPSFYVYVEKNR